MKAPYRDTRPTSAGGAPPLPDLDAVSGAVLATQRKISPALSIIMVAFIVGLGTLGIVLALNNERVGGLYMAFFALVLAGIFVSSLISRERLWRIEVREGGVVYVWIRRQRHGGHRRFIPWEDVAAVKQVRYAARDQTYYIELHTGKTFDLGARSEKVTRAALQRARQIGSIEIDCPDDLKAELGIEDDEIRKLREIQNSMR